MENTIQSRQYNKKVRIHCHSIRKRLVDPDAISIKAVIDGIVEAGLLKDDTAKEIESPTFSQEQGSEEITVICITET